MKTKPSGLLSVFFIKRRYKAIWPEQQSGNPLRSPAHLHANGIQVDIIASFNDKFVMYMAADETMGKRSYGIT